MDRIWLAWVKLVLGKWSSSDETIGKRVCEGAGRSERREVPMCEGEGSWPSVQAVWRVGGETTRRRPKVRTRDVSTSPEPHPRQDAETRRPLHASTPSTVWRWQRTRGHVYHAKQSGLRCGNGAFAHFNSNTPQLPPTTPHPPPSTTNSSNRCSPLTLIQPANQPLLREGERGPSPDRIPETPIAMKELAATRQSAGASGRDQ